MLIKLCCISVIPAFICQFLFTNFIYKLSILCTSKFGRHTNVIVFNDSRNIKKQDKSYAYQYLSQVTPNFTTVMILSFRPNMPWKNSANPDQTICHFVCIVWTHYSMVEQHGSNFRVITSNVWVSDYLGNLRYISDAFLNGDVSVMWYPYGLL